VLASVVIWIGQQVCVFDTVLAAIRPLVVLMGLPPEAATAFLFGFFRRDYGAAGLYDLHRTSGLTGNQLFVACLTLTLFLPCIAQWMVLFKEHGWKFAVAVGVGVMAVACGSGMAAHMILSGTGARL
jgi:ferrous iron transport protein B